MLIVCQYQYYILIEMCAVSRDRSAESATVLSSAAGEKSAEAIVEQVEAPMLTVHSAEAEVSAGVTYVESSAESATVSSSAAGEKSVRKFHSSFVLPNPSNLSPDLAEFMFKDLVDSLLLSSFEDAG